MGIGAHKLKENKLTKDLWMALEKGEAKGNMGVGSSFTWKEGKNGGAEGLEREGSLGQQEGEKERRDGKGGSELGNG